MINYETCVCVFGVYCEMMLVTWKIAYICVGTMKKLHSIRLENEYGCVVICLDSV